VLEKTDLAASSDFISWLVQRVPLTVFHQGLVPERNKIQFRIVGHQAVLTQGLINGGIDAYLDYKASASARKSFLEPITRCRRANAQSHRQVGCLSSGPGEQTKRR
jgi:hypothetical protein